MSHYRNGPVAPGIAFITGGARGLGNAIARSFAKEGARGVALVDIQDEKTFNEGKANVEKYGAKVSTLQFSSFRSYLDNATSASPYVATLPKKTKSNELCKKRSIHLGESTTLLISLVLLGRWKIPGISN